MNNPETGGRFFFSGQERRKDDQENYGEATLIEESTPHDKAGPVSFVIKGKLADKIRLLSGYENPVNTIGEEIRDYINSFFSEKEKEDFYAENWEPSELRFHFKSEKEKYQAEQRAKNLLEKIKEEIIQRKLLELDQLSSQKNVDLDKLNGEIFKLFELGILEKHEKQMLRAREKEYVAQTVELNEAARQGEEAMWRRGITKLASEAAFEARKYPRQEFERKGLEIFEKKLQIFFQQMSYHTGKNQEEVAKKFADEISKQRIRLCELLNIGN